MERIWYVADSGEMTCDDCAYSALVDDAGEYSNVDAPRAWKAAVKLAALSYDSPSPREVARVLEEAMSTRRYDRDRGSVNGAPSRYSAIDAALTWHYSHVSDVSNEADSPNGEYCGGCSAELSPAWCECEVCERDGAMGDSYGPGSDPFAVTDHGDSGDGFRVVCGECWQGWETSLQRAGLTLSADEREAVRESMDANGSRWETTADGTWRRLPDRYNLRGATGRVVLGLIVPNVHRERMDAMHGGGMFPREVVAV